MNPSEASRLLAVLRHCPDAGPILPIIEGFLCGQIVEINYAGRGWRRINDPAFHLSPDNYRLVVEDRGVRPFADAHEAMIKIVKHKNWVLKKFNGDWCVVTRTTQDGVTLECQHVGWVEFLKEFRFDDGPCGMEDGS